MTFLELAKLLHAERERHFGPNPFGISIISVLPQIEELYSNKHSELFPSVKAAIRQFSRNRTLTWSSLEEEQALTWRFDFAIAVLLFLAAMKTEDGKHIVADPDPSIPEEDLIEWALIAIFTYEHMNGNAWALKKLQQDVGNQSK
jgi:hypothetical protein